MTDTDRLALTHILRAAIDTMGSRVGEPSMRYLVAQAATENLLRDPALKDAEATDSSDGIMLIRQLLVS